MQRWKLASSSSRSRSSRARAGKSVRVTKGGTSPSTNDVGGYSVLQAESKEALAEPLKGHPHFMMPDGSIEVVEAMPIPGM